METVIAALAEAAAGDPAGLDRARAAWPALDADDRAAVAALGRLVAAPGPRSAGLPEALRALAAGDVPAARAVFGDLADPEREAVGAVGRRIAGRGRARPSPAEPEDLLPLMGLDGFRPGQREAVRAALDGRDCLVVMPTGGGKSLCYQLPALARDGVTVVVSPLIALITDQHARLVAHGHRAVMLASSAEADDNTRALDRVRAGDARIVFCAPERFGSVAFRAALAACEVSLFVVDEAHCVAEWGHDFRPDYLRLAAAIDSLGRPPVMAATATATPAVAAEIVARLGLRDPVLVSGGFDRPNITFDVVPLDGRGAVERKRRMLLDGLRDPGMRPAIVYCGTRRDTDEVRALVSDAGLAAVGYHAGMEQSARAAAQEAFMSGAAEVIVATNAFGQGIDKADIRSVWHWALPTSVEAYYQEAGRAGRDGRPARAVLMAMRADLGRLLRFIRESEVTVPEVERLVDRIRRDAGDGVAILDGRGGGDRERIALGVAERAGALVLEPAPGGRVAARPSGTLDRGAVRAACRAAVDRRWTAYRALTRFVEGDGTCRRRQILAHFGSGEQPAPVVRCCDVCEAPPAPPPSAAAATGSGGGRARAAATPPPAGDPRWEALTRWRTARAAGKPAYTVATNATLLEVLRTRPADHAALLAIRGIGPAFVANHGDDLLETLRTLG